MKMTNSERPNIAMVKENLSAYVTKAEKGETVVVCRRNKPVAMIVPLSDASPTNRTKLSALKGSVIIKCDLTKPALSKSDWGSLW